MEKSLLRIHVCTTYSALLGKFWTISGFVCMCERGVFPPPPFIDLEAKCRPSLSLRDNCEQASQEILWWFNPALVNILKKYTSPIKYCFSEGFLKVSKINLLFLLTMN